MDPSFFRRPDASGAWRSAWSFTMPEDDFVMEQVGFRALWIGVEDAEA